MEPSEVDKKKKTKKILKKNSSAYIKQREKANARKRKFLDKMTEEQREIKRAKDREYYQKKKAEKKIKKAADMTERELRKQRKQWKQASKKYRDKKKMFENVVSNTPPPSDTELVGSPQNSVRRQRGRKSVKKDRAKAYRTLKKQQDVITEMRRKIEALNKKIRRKEKAEKKKDNEKMTPNSKVNDLIKDIPVPVPREVRKRLLFGEVLSTQLKTKSAALKKNSKEREIFQRCISGTGIRKYKLLHMAKAFIPKQKNNKTILMSDKKVREVVLKPDVRRKVEDFFQKDDVSRMCSGKRDFVIKNGVKKQKRVLLSTIKALHPKFVQETGVYLSYTTLRRAKPYWAVAPKLRDRETCLCVKHENFELKIRKLNSLKQTECRDTEAFIKDYLCDPTSYECMNGLCDNCKELTLDEGENEDTITYFQWQSINKESFIKGEKKIFKMTSKVPITTTVKKLRKALAEEIPTIKQHLYGIYNYNKQKKNLKETMTENEIMIQIDFSENYTTKYANEIQSSHFVKNQLTIHTGVYYSRNDDHQLQATSFATVSQNLDHQAHAVWAHLKPILRKILENKKIDTLHIYSDGPTSQYRNRTNIYLWLKTLIDEFQQITKSTWTFSEPGHGKGPMDGVGGVLKRTADSHVLMGRDIKTASEFVNLFTDSSIHVEEISDDEVKVMKEKIPKLIHAVPGVMKITNINWKKTPEVFIELYQYQHLQKVLKLQMLSKDECNNVKSMDSRDDIVPLEIDTCQTEESTEINFKALCNVNYNRPNIYKTIYNSSSSDDEDLQTISLRQKAINTNFKDIAAGSSYDTNTKENIHPNLIGPGTFLLVKVPTQKRDVFYRYLAISQTCVEDDGEVKVTFLRSVRNTAKIFQLDPKDVSYVTFQEIIEIIPTPSLKVEKNREYYHFKSNVDIFEKC